jgi:glucose-1-phosphate thymidylyltransferase
LLLGDGAASWGLGSLRGAAEPDGLAQAFIIGEQFIGATGAPRARRQHLLRHDGFANCARRRARPRGATVFAYPVTDPERYGVVEFDAEGPADRASRKSPPGRSRATP